MDTSGRRVLGAILAGGASRRFGTSKALARVGGRTLVERAHDALSPVVTDVILVTEDGSLRRGLRARVVPDTFPGEGPLAGIHAALAHGDALGFAGALCLACDLPFASPALLGALVDRAASDPKASAVAPESEGRRGVEPLCAYYAVGALPAVERLLRTGVRSAYRALQSLPRVVAVPLAEVRTLGDPRRLFLNVNTREDHARALRIDGAEEPHAPV